MKPKISIEKKQVTPHWGGPGPVGLPDPLAFTDEWKFSSRLYPGGILLFINNIEIAKIQIDEQKVLDGRIRMHMQGDGLRVICRGETVGVIPINHIKTLDKSTTDP